MFLNDSLKQKNIITVNDGIITHTESEWVKFFGYTPKNLTCCSFHKEKKVNFWFPIVIRADLGLMYYPRMV